MILTYFHFIWIWNFLKIIWKIWKNLIEITSKKKERKEKKYELEKKKKRKKV